MEPLSPETHETTTRPLLKDVTVGLDIHPSLKPPWLHEAEALRIPVPAIYPCPQDGETLLSFVLEGRKFPVLQKRGTTLFYGFSYAETLEYVRSEKYRDFKRSLLSYLPYHHDWIPSSIRRSISNLLAHTKKKLNKDGFPDFPTDESLHALIHVVETVEQSGRGLHTSHFTRWPAGKDYCVVLTHDVETPQGLTFCMEIQRLEASYGLKSSWNVVGMHAEKNRRILDELYEQGCEIGLHGYDHTLRTPYLPIQTIQNKLFKCEMFLRQYSMKGFRSPFYLRSQNLFTALQPFFLYDSSVPDVDVFSPGVSRGGCCTIFPYEIGRMIELPVTIPYEIILHRGWSPDKLNAFWSRKIHWIKEAGGMILLNSHAEPQYLGNKQIRKAYEELLKTLSDDRQAWFALPCQVADRCLSMKSGPP